MFVLQGNKNGESAPLAEDSSGALMLRALPFSVYHFNRALTPSVSTSQRQMGLLMQWCGYVRPAIAASPVCLYRSTEREGEKGAENAKGSLWVCRCVRLRVSVSHYACADTHAHTHTHVSGVKLNSAGQMLWEWRDKSGRIDLLSPVWWTPLPL